LTETIVNQVIFIEDPLSTALLMDT